MNKNSLISLVIILAVMQFDTVFAFIPSADDLENTPKKPEQCYGSDNVLDARCCIFPPFFVREVARECGAIFALVYRKDEYNMTTFRRQAMTVRPRAIKEQAKRLTKIREHLAKEKSSRANQTITRSVKKASVYELEEKTHRKKKYKKRKEFMLNNYIRMDPRKSKHRHSDWTWQCILEKYQLLNPDKTLNMDRYFEHLDKWVYLNPAFSKVISEGRLKCKYRFQMFLPLKTNEYFTFQTCIRTYVNMHCPQRISTELCNEQKIFYEQCAQYYF